MKRLSLFCLVMLASAVSCSIVAPCGTDDLSMRVCPATESQCFPASGSFGFFVAASIGQRARAPTRAPTAPPSRSGFTLTLITVPTGNVAAVYAVRLNR